MFISKISAKNLGPIKEFNEEFRHLNLIYAHNEQGKTFLVEYIIRCLFENRGEWSTSFREINANGKILIEGLEEKVVVFTKDSQPKIENFLKEDKNALPPDITKLLVVKGSDPAIANNFEGGMSKQVLNNFLSQKEFLNEIDNGIKKTIKEAEIKNGVVDGHRRSLISDLEDLNDELDKIGGFITRVSNEYSRGTIKSLTKRKEELEAEKRKLLDAKRHKAYLLNEKSNELEQKIDAIPDNKLQSLSDEIASYRRANESYQDKQERFEKLNSKSENYEWLNKAHSTYKDYLFETSGELDYKWVIGAVISAVLTILFITVDIPMLAILSIILVVSFVVWGVSQFKNTSERIRTSEELKRIQEEFENRFNSKLSNLASLEERLEEEQEAHMYAEQLHEDLKKESDALRKQETTIKDIFDDLIEEGVDREEWIDKLAEIREDLKELQKAKQQIDKEFARLNIQQSNLLDEDVDIEYSEIKLDEVQQKLEDIEEKIRANEQQLDSLKNELCTLLVKDFSVEWNLIINDLHERRKEVVDEIKELKAEIIGKIFVHKVIENLREEEDERIADSLSSSELQTPIHSVTERYETIKLQDEELVVSDEYSDFALSQLSTGAKEQIMLALRIGLTSKLFKDSKPFLILDDAFQNSDYPHREIMVNKLSHLAENGHQIFYLTMDDHLRDLFKKKGEQLGTEFKSISLNS